MKIRNILYISAIMLLAGCSKDADISNSTTLSGNGEKTPLLINATLDTSKGQTRAAGGSFENGDVLKAYVRHTTNAGSVGSYTYLSNDPSNYGNKLVTISYDGSAFTSDSYWDDFSQNNDLKGENHGLQAYYGYCYNHGSASTEIVETTTTLTDTDKGGTFTWRVQENQNQTDGSGYTYAKKSDVLWASEQTSVPYDHSTAHAGAGVNHGTLSLPYYHAMSEITVTVTAAVGFVASNHPLDDTELILNKMNYESVLTARTKTFIPSVQTDDNKLKSITMYSESYTSPYTVRHFTAIVAPGTKLKEGEKLLDIQKADGNYYEVIITSDMLQDTDGAEVDKGWSNSTPPTDGGKHYIVTQPGVNYHLDITIDKSAVQVSANLDNWSDVTATGTGNIDFPNIDTNLVMDDAGITQNQNVQVAAISENKFKGNSTFSLFWLVAGTGNTNNEKKKKKSSTRTNDNYGFITQMTFQDNIGSSDAWTYTPVFYWPNRTDKYYFRALAKFNGTEHVDDHYADNISLVNDGDNTIKDVVVSQGTISAGVASNGPDIIWGTTAHHWGMTAPVKEYNRSYAIAPRTGGVPIVFEHVMSKITFALETTDDDDYKKVNLTGATIAISNLYTQGKIKLDDGSMDFSDYIITAAAIPATTAISGLFVVPQTFTNDAIVTIVLPNEPSAEGNATYTIKLKDLTDGSTAITQWEKGKNYTYTIHVDKEKVIVNALVKEWEGVVGSGTATLTW